MTSVQPYITQPEFIYTSQQKDVISSDLNSKVSITLKWVDLTMENIIQNKKVDIISLLDELENRDEGFTEDEFAVWWNKNKNTLNI